MFNKLLFTSLFHSITYFTILFIIYSFLIINTENNAIYKTIKHALNINVYNVFKQNPYICSNYLKYKPYFDNNLGHLSYSSQIYNIKLIIIIIILIFCLIIFLIFSYRFLKIYNIQKYNLYFIDLLLVVLAIGAIEYLFFINIGSKYVTII